MSDTSSTTPAEPPSDMASSAKMSSAQAPSDAPAATPPSDSAGPPANPEPTAPSPSGAAPAVPASGGTSFTLTATNNSTVPGNQYFSVFPLPLITPPQPQTPVALVSSATVTGGGTAAIATMTWSTGPDALALITLAPGQDVVTAPRTPVALGSTVAVTWVNDGFGVTVTATGSTNTITVTFGTGIPSSSSIGLVVGPGPILVPIPAGGGGLVLTPDLTPSVTVRFGTPADPGDRNFSDVSQTAPVACVGTAAAITVGLNNLITPTG